MTPQGRGRSGVALVGVSLSLVWLTSFLGSSAASRHLPGQGWLPPYRLDTRPSAELVSGLLLAAFCLGAYGTVRTARAAREGWAPALRALRLGAIAAAVAFVLVPPVTNDDVYSYAAYGRLVVLGHNPYVTAPAGVEDPVTDEAGRPWRETPSVYGPVATGVQAAVLVPAGDSVRAAAFGFVALAAAAFVGLLLLAERLAADDDRRRRVLLLVGLNPLVLVHLVPGAHLDGLLVVGVLAALLAVRRERAVLAGLALGAAVAVKVSAVLAVLGVLWWWRREPRRLAALALGGGLVLAPGYALAGGMDALRQTREASRYVSLATPWRPLTNLLDDLLGRATSRQVVGVLALLAVVALGWLLARALPSGDAVVRLPLVPTLAWLLAATYLLPWYDAWAWPLLALLAWSWWDHVLRWHTLALSLAYLPGREVALPYPLSSVLGSIRRDVVPVVLAVVVAWAVVRAVRETRHHVTSAPPVGAT